MKNNKLRLTSVLVVTIFCFNGCLFAQATNKLDSTGNVGIGTTSPVYPLHVEKNHGGATFLLIRNTENGANAYSGIRVTGQNQTITLSANSDGMSRSYPGFHNASVALMGDALNGLNIISNAGAGTPNANTGVIRFITYNAAGGVTSSGAGNDAFTRMFIDGNGQVGIGTITPSEKLSVNGNIKAQKIIVTQAGWSDYVFDGKYKLRSLTELEAFIKENKHLPEVPTTKEIENQGVSIGDVQSLLLKKIEDLTLYLLQQDKKIKSLEKKIIDQSKN